MSQILCPRPSSFVAPSIWKLEVETPQMKFRHRPAVEGNFDAGIKRSAWLPAEFTFEFKVHLSAQAKCVVVTRPAGDEAILRYIKSFSAAGAINDQL